MDGIELLTVVQIVLAVSIALPCAALAILGKGTRQRIS